MLAWTQTTYGPPSVLRLQEVPEPALGPRDVRIAVATCAVTQGDRRVRSGEFPGMTALPGRLAMGFTGPRKRPGSMIAGEIAEVGAEVERYRVGDRVVAACLDSGLAESVVLPETGPIGPLPAGWSLREGAALLYGGGTALHFLQTVAALQPGEHLVVLGAAGGVGRYAVQLGRHLGARVTAVCSARDADLVRSLGADAVVDYHTADFREGGSPCDVVFDTVGASSWSACRSAMAPTGRYASLMLTVGGLVQMALNPVRGGQKVLVGVHIDTADTVRGLVEIAEAGAVRPRLVEAFAWDEVPAAHALLERGRVGGDVVVTVSEAAVGRADAPRPSPRLVSSGGGA